MMRLTEGAHKTNDNCKHGILLGCSAKHAHYLLGEGDKVGESSKWKHIVLIEIKEEASKKLCKSSED